MANLTKDQRIIRDNPDKSPYELLQLGLSQKAYEELLAKDQSASGKPPEETVDEVLAKSNNVSQSLGDTEKGFVENVVLTEVKPAEEPQKVKATVEKEPRATPKIIEVPAEPVPYGMAWLVNKVTGKRTYMTFEAASRRKKSHPDTYSIES